MADKIQVPVHKSNQKEGHHVDHVIDYVSCAGGPLSRVEEAPISVPPTDFAINKEKVSCHWRGTCSGRHAIPQFQFQFQHVGIKTPGFGEHSPVAIGLGFGLCLPEFGIVDAGSVLGRDNKAPNR